MPTPFSVARASLAPHPGAVVDDLNTLVRRVDEDRWLASRFAAPHVLERLIALYAVNYEIAHAAESVREAALGDVRLEWWREGLQEILEGATPRSHPALVALSRTMKHVTVAAALQGIVDARAADLEPQPFAAWTDLERYVDLTAGALIRVAIDSCDAPPAPDAFVMAAGRAWGFTGLLRAAPYWQAKGRSAIPREGGDSEELKRRAFAAHVQARTLGRALRSEAFPAAGYLATVPGYLRALERGVHETALFGRQVAMVVASATGRL